MINMEIDISYKVAEKSDLYSLVSFLSLPEIDLSFVKPLSKRDLSIEERVQMKYEHGLWLLAIDSRTIAGCLALIPSGENYVEISTYAVSQKHQGKGIGGRLIEDAITLCKQRYSGFSKIILDSWEGNNAVANLMQKKGFKLVNSFYDSVKRPEGIKTLIYEKSLI